HVLVAFALGAAVFDRGYRPVAGLTVDRSLLVHLHLAALGWLTLLIVAVGRTLGPMLAAAPTARPRTLPRDELLLTGGLWLLVAGLGMPERALALAGGAVVVLALCLFGSLVVCVGRTTRLPVEAPLAHMLAGVAFLVQAAALGFAMETGAVGGRVGVVAYVVLLLLGFAAGTTLGHVGKLLSLSLWVWWPPGPRPKQEELYPRRLWLVEAECFAAGAEVVAAGALATSTAAVRAGAALLVASATLAAAGAWLTWSRRASRGAGSRARSRPRARSAG